MTRYSIYEGHMDALRAKVAKIERKCAKYGCTFHYAEVGEEFREVEAPDGETVTVKYVSVEVEGTAIINDWVFIASIEHTKEGNLFHKALTDIELPMRYRTSAPICEHCMTNHYRKNTCIVMHAKTGDFKQVGNACLKDYTHGLSAEMAAWFASIKDAFEEAEQAHVTCGGYHETYIDTMDILTYAAETIRHYGYVKSDERDSTRSRVTDFIRVGTGRTAWMHKDAIAAIRDEMRKVGFDASSAEAVQLAKDALTWIREQDAGTDYLHNLKVACNLPYAGYDRIGVLCSLFPTYKRELEVKSARELKAEAHKAEAERSQYVGNIGDRISVAVTSCEVLTSFDSCFDGYHVTTTYIYKLVGEDGNVYKWKTSKLLGDNVKSIKGTVKAHSEYRDVRQTELTRCTVA